LQNWGVMKKNENSGSPARTSRGHSSRRIRPLRRPLLRWSARCPRTHEHGASRTVARNYLIISLLFFFFEFPLCLWKISNTAWSALCKRTKEYRGRLILWTRRGTYGEHRTCMANVDPICAERWRKRRRGEQQCSTAEPSPASPTYRFSLPIILWHLAKVALYMVVLVFFCYFKAMVVFWLKKFDGRRWCAHVVFQTSNLFIFLSRGKNKGSPFFANSSCTSLPWLLIYSCLIKLNDCPQGKNNNGKFSVEISYLPWHMRKGKPI
jgi:hypothetical protein